LATVACPSCFGMMFLGAKFCSHCGARADRTEPGMAVAERCPRCRLQMNAVTIGNAQLLECPRCEGLWADRLSLEQVCADREKQTVVLGLPSQLPETASRGIEQIRYVPCPVCKKLMNRVNFARCSQVIVDVCAQHGTWFDKDELRRIVEFIRAGGLEKAREKEIADLEEKRRRVKAEQVADAWDTRSDRLDGRSEYWRDGISAVASAIETLLR
jgi:Zn-finger nucleic acid-binding protein